MKKLLTILFISVILLSNSAKAKDKEIYTPREIRAIQSRTYETSDADLVAQKVIKILESQQYENIKYYKDIQYITAEKKLSVKEVRKNIIALYIARMGWDVVYTFLTAGLKAYTLAVDAFLIKLEFDDKYVLLKTAINITPCINNKTEVRNNTLYIMDGKGIGIVIGKLSRFKTVNLKDNDHYKSFFKNLDKEMVGYTNIKYPK